MAEPASFEERTQRLLPAAQAGSRAAQEALLELHAGLIEHVVRRFRGSGQEEEDLRQAAALGLVKAVQRFDPARGAAFSTYAVPLMIGEVRRLLRDDGPVKIDRAAKGLARQAKQARHRIRQERGYEPTVAELAEHLGVSAQRLGEVLAAAEAPASLQQPAQGDEGGPLPLDRLANPDDWWEQLALRHSVEQLPPRLARVVQLRFYLDRSQEEVGRLLGISQAQVSRLEKKALEQLREFLREA